MGESRNVRVKWTADTQQAVDATDRYKKSVTGAGQATKQTSKATQEFNQEAQSQVKTMLGVGAVLQAVGQGFAAYNAEQAQAAALATQVALRTEQATGAITALGNATRLTRIAEERRAVASGAGSRELAKRQTENTLKETLAGRAVTGVVSGLESIPIIGPILETFFDEIKVASSEGGEISTEATRRGEFVERGEAFIGGLSDPQAQGRANQAILEELQKGNNFNLSTVRKAAETQ